MRINNIIFDLDGTLLDTTEGVIESAIYAIKAMNYEELAYDTMLSFVGPPIQESFSKHYNCNSEEAQNVANIFRDYYKENALFKAKPYEGIFELLEQLKKAGKKIAVATYKREDYALTLLKHFGLDQYFESIHGADNKNTLKKADIIGTCICELNATKENSVLVGDTIHDAVGAEKAGISFIAVTYGFGFKVVLDVMEYKNIGIAETPLDIYRLTV